MTAIQEVFGLKSTELRTIAWVRCEVTNLNRQKESSGKVWRKCFIYWFNVHGGLFKHW